MTLEKKNILIEEENKKIADELSKNKSCINEQKFIQDNKITNLNAEMQHI